MTAAKTDFFNRIEKIAVAQIFSGKR